MEFFQDPNTWLTAGGIFLLRVLSIATDTVRLMLVLRGKKAIAWVLSIITSLLFVLSIGNVMNDLNNPVKLLAYSVGFATGTVVGMSVEKKLAVGHMQITIISSIKGPEIAEKLRNEGYGVTEIPARGKDGMVTMLECGLLRKDLDTFQKLITKVDPEAYITARDLEPVHRGYWGIEKR